MPGQIQVVKKQKRRELIPISENFRDNYRDKNRLGYEHLHKARKVGETALCAPEELDVDAVPAEPTERQQQLEPEFAIGFLLVEAAEA